MDFFSYRDGVLHCEELPAEKLAEEFGRRCTSTAGRRSSTTSTRSARPSRRPSR